MWRDSSWSSNACEELRMTGFAALAVRTHEKKLAATRKRTRPTMAARLSCERPEKLMILE
eukprot:CAMPEP_0169353900 /NCGR_PEP_ID=MMETSP1017-20121227/26143_1 /TAXON_ID=342587 /ORGANISM="Karlodinium micrum, Strain CCMP2283" /LENGTH=59 /DNA_ID=CAMNT_0009450427 /DNA_START=508 /DNA_END=684 /DNA_ORIENTATION=+